MKPVSIGAAWTEANQFIKREAGLLFPVILLFVAIPVALIFQAIPPELRQVAPGADRPEVQIPLPSLFLIIACSLVVIGGTLCCYALAVKPGISLKEALTLGFRRMPVALGAALIVGVAIGLPMVVLNMASPSAGAVFMLVAALLLSARLLVLNPVIVDGEGGPLQGLRQSWALTRGNGGRLLLFIVVITIPIMLAQVVAEILFGLIGVSLGGAVLGRQMGDLGAATALAVGQAYMIVIAARIYRQLSVR